MGPADYLYRALSLPHVLFSTGLPHAPQPWSLAPRSSGHVTPVLVASIPSCIVGCWEGTRMVTADAPKEIRRPARTSVALFTALHMGTTTTLPSWLLLSQSQRYYSRLGITSRARRRSASPGHAVTSHWAAASHPAPAGIVSRPSSRTAWVRRSACPSRAAQQRARGPCGRGLGRRPSDICRREGRLVTPRRSACRRACSRPITST